MIAEPAPDEVRFSIFIPVRNDGIWLAGAMESVLAQTHTHWEMVIGDNASDDGTAEVVARYDDPRIRYRHWPNHVGLCENYNRTVALTSYEWVQPLAADDRLQPECLEVLAERIRAHRPDPGGRLAMVLTAARHVNAAGESTDVEFYGYQGRQPMADGRYDASGWLFAFCRPGQLAWGLGSAAFARAALDELGRFLLDDDPIVTPDLELALTVAAYGDVIFVDRPLLDVTYRPESDAHGMFARDRGRERDLSANGAALLSGLRAHESRRWVSPAERRAVFGAVARASLQRAAGQRYLPGGGGRAAAWRDVRRAFRFSPRTMLSPALVGRAIFIVTAPREMVVQVRQRAVDRRARRGGPA